MGHAKIRIVEGSDSLASAAADAIVHAANQAIDAEGRFTIALSGGSTPEKAYQLLALPERSRQLDWKRIHVFFSDERFVPHDDSRSNYALAARTFLKLVPIPSANVYAIPVEGTDVQTAAKSYSAMLARFFGISELNRPPKIDFILLGLGDDGHTASLFPGKPSLTETKAWFIGTPPGVLPPPVDRITATLPLLNTGKKVVFLVGGEKKRDIVKAVLIGKNTSYPSVHVQPEFGQLVWLLDSAAASGLKLFTGEHRIS